MLPLVAPGTFGQIFTPPNGDMVQLTTGSVTASAAWCHADGVIAVTYPGGAENITLEAGDQIGFPAPLAVSVTSGTWSFM